MVWLGGLVPSIPVLGLLDPDLLPLCFSELPFLLPLLQLVVDGRAVWMVASLPWIIRRGAGGNYFAF